MLTSGCCSAFHTVLSALVGEPFYNSYIKLPPVDALSDIIKDCAEFFPWFKDCLGAVDGSLLYAFVSALDMARFRCRKSFISQNIFAACRFDLLFCFLLTGWEGSAADGRIFEDARKTGFAIPEGQYYLGDAGFPTCKDMLVPYRGTRYHLNEWQKSGYQR